jgi:hypothetical protein
VALGRSIHAYADDFVVAETPVKLLPQYRPLPSVVVFKDNHHESRVMNSPFEVRLMKLLLLMVVTMRTRMMR